MELERIQIFSKIDQNIINLPLDEFHLNHESENSRENKMKSIIRSHCQNHGSEILNRIEAEYFALGPLENILIDEQITEIIVNGPNDLWYEKGGKLIKHSDHFYSSQTFTNCIERICLEMGKQITQEFPVIDGHFRDFRISIISHELTFNHYHFTLRRHPKNPWTFSKLEEKNWANKEQIQLLSQILHDHSSFIVVGGTGSGKTSLLNSFLQLLPENERAIIIEDTKEIQLPNSASMRLMTRQDAQGLLPEIDQTQLLKRALRLRPDRIIMGEIRGNEAKDFLQAMATGHHGSFASLHADNPHQALIRLEMLIQMGAPQWQIQAIRKLILMSLQYIIVVGRTNEGLRKLVGIYKLSSLEEHGFTIEQID